MNKSIEISFLYEIYKSLLTEKMKEIFEDYYYLDLSLREIGENRKISYQAVRDSIKNTEKLLLEYESKLKINELKKRINEVKVMVEQDEKKDNIIQILKDLGEG